VGKGDFLKSSETEYRIRAGSRGADADDGHEAAVLGGFFAAAGEKMDMAAKREYERNGSLRGRD
jgi:hypothetical protein